MAAEVTKGMLIIALVTLTFHVKPSREAVFHKQGRIHGRRYKTFSPIKERALRTYGLTNGPMGQQMDIPMDGQTDQWTDGWTDRQID